MDKDKTITYRPLSDMESDGVYFPENIKKELTDLREKEHCHYSGLPSVEWYSQNSKSSTEIESREIKLEDVFGQEKKEKLKEFISEHKRLGRK